MIVQLLRSRRAAGLMVLLGMVGCAGALARPTDADARWAASRWPGTTLRDLERGRSLYVSRCGSCHGLPAPESHPPDAWRAFVKDMSADAKLTPTDAHLVAAFLASVSARRGRTSSDAP